VGHSGVALHGHSWDCRRFGAATAYQCEGSGRRSRFSKISDSLALELAKPSSVGYARKKSSLITKGFDMRFTKGFDMRCAKHPPIRNKIDLSDPGQVRAWKRRLGLSTSDLQRIVEKVGNSISAVIKEIELERMPTETPPVVDAEQPTVPALA
jgi:hypothetical protein